MRRSEERTAICFIAFVVVCSAMVLETTMAALPGDSYAAGRRKMEEDANYDVVGLGENRVGSKTGWKVVGRSEPGVRLELTFAVRHNQQGKEILEERLLQAATPGSPLYGKHLSNEQVHKILQPAEEHVASVKAFLKSFQVTFESVNSDIIVCDVSVRQAEALLGAKYYELRQIDGGREHGSIHRILSKDGYTLPSNVAEAVDFVAPTVTVPTLRRRRAGKPGLPRSLVNTPESLRKLYSVGNAQGSASGNKQAVTAFIGQHYSASELGVFYKYFCTNQSFACGMDGKVDVVQKGDDKKPGAGTESMLDIEYITSVGSNVATEFWGFSGNSPDNKQNEPFIKWLTLASNTSDADVPKLFSTSYGEDEASCSQAWAVRLNTEFQKLGSRGISLLFASGDSGAAGESGCDGKKFVPEWPSSSPWITSVGGTAGLGGNETAAGLSSGGFSNRWARPAWQKDAVNAYLSQPGIPPKDVFNSSNTRGSPDISAQAVNFLVVQFGVPIPVAGTSCASPTAAAVIGLLNDVRLAAGKSTLGFLNPLIYGQSMSSWNDITSGESGGCGFSQGGWPAKVGWDPVTGCGTPDFAKLKTVVAGL
eukprot:g4289.t1